MRQPTRREVTGQDRKARIVVGGASVPIAILLNAVILRVWELDMGTDVSIALSSMLGSLVSVALLCFWDLRGVVLAYFAHRRLKD